MLAAYNQAVTEVDLNNTDWHKPIEILNKYIKQFKLQNYIRDDMSYHDDWRVIHPFIKTKKLVANENYYFIHWLNEEWRARQLSKDEIRINSTLGTLIKQYGVDDTKYSFAQKTLNFIKTTNFFGNLKLLNVVD
jgi:hypothetical protein